MKRAMFQRLGWMVMAMLAAVTAIGGTAAAQDWRYNDGRYYSGGSYSNGPYNQYNRYYDRGRPDPLQIAYDNGYRDGLQRGHYDSRERFKYNIHSQLYNDGRDGYERWMCHFGDYKRAFREGYARGYSEGYDRRFGNGWR